jgi:hypothetical protein
MPERRFKWSHKRTSNGNSTVDPNQWIRILPRYQATRLPNGSWLLLNGLYPSGSFEPKGRSNVHHAPKWPERQRKDVRRPSSWDH